MKGLGAQIVREHRVAGLEIQVHVILVLAHLWVLPVDPIRRRTVVFYRIYPRVFRVRRGGVKSPHHASVVHDPPPSQTKSDKRSPPVPLKELRHGELERMEH